MSEATHHVLADIEAERFRQMSVEGWTPEHDDTHVNGEMSRAAAAYAYEASRTDYQRTVDAGRPPQIWPWDAAWWKPSDRRRDLIKAASLIIAEIERLDRRHPTPPSETAKQAGETA